MHFPTGHLQEHPLPPGVVGALSLSGYQLLVDVAGVGAGRIGQQAFLLVAADPEPGRPSEVTHISLHSTRLGGEPEATAFTDLASQLGYLRLSGYKFALERMGLRSKLRLVNPASGRIEMEIPEKHGGGLFGGGASVSSYLQTARALPQPGTPADSQSPELLRQAFLALAVRDDDITGEDAPDVADRALAIALQDPSLDPVTALERAKAAAAEPPALPEPPASREPPQFT